MELCEFCNQTKSKDRIKSGARLENAMIEIIHNLFLGSQKSHEEAEAKGYAILSCDKDGEFGHRQWGKYDTRAAPKGPDYYYIRRGDEMRLNLIDRSEEHTSELQSLRH